MKKAIVEYHGKDPIGVREVKDFRTEASFEAFATLCANNKKKADLEEKKALEEERVKEDLERIKDNRRWAHVAWLFVEIALDHGELTLTDEEYAEAWDNFNDGEIKDLSKMPEVFIKHYYELRRE